MNNSKKDALAYIGAIRGTTANLFQWYTNQRVNGRVDLADYIEGVVGTLRSNTDGLQSALECDDNFGSVPIHHERPVYCPIDNTQGIAYLGEKRFSVQYLGRTGKWETYYTDPKTDQTIRLDFMSNDLCEVLNHISKVHGYVIPVSPN